MNFTFQYNIIDEEHKILFNGIFMLAREDTPENLAELRRVTQEHFAHEEVNNYVCSKLQVNFI